MLPKLKTYVQISVLHKKPELISLVKKICIDGYGGRKDS